MRLVKFVKSIVEQGGYTLPKEKEEFFKSSYGHGLSDHEQLAIQVNNYDIGALKFYFRNDAKISLRINLVHGITYTLDEENRYLWEGKPTWYFVCIKEASPYTNYMLIKEHYLDFINLAKKYLEIDCPDNPEAQKKRWLYRFIDRPFDGNAKALYDERKKEIETIIEDFKKSFYERFPYMLEYDLEWKKCDASMRFHEFMRDSFVLKEMGISFNDSDRFNMSLYGKLD